MNKLTATAAILALLLGVSVATYHVASRPKQPPPKTAQSFRFGEQCPDGLRVEYVNAFRLPKSVVCQKAVGE